jgi:hypothetical protein
MGQIKIMFKVKNGRLIFLKKKKKRKKWKKYKKGGHNSEGDGKPQL